MSAFPILRRIGLAAFVTLAASGTIALAAQEPDAAPDRVAETFESTTAPAADGTREAEPVLQFAQASCAAAAAQAAAQTGGQVLSVSSRNEGGRVVCVVTVLIPGQDGGRPRRTTITVPG